MADSLPVFRYHPDPVATGNVQASAATCACCGRACGWVYVGAVHGPSELDDRLCPWCIADGTAARRFDVSFADDHALARAGLANEIIDEVSLGTPGYTSWQQDDWLTHCNDACEFHGDASIEDIDDASEATKADWAGTWPARLSSAARRP